MLRAKEAPNVATWNVFYENSRANIERGIRALAAANADVIGLNELSIDSTQDFVTDLAKRMGWTATSRNSAVTMLVNTAQWALVEQSHLVVHKGGLAWEPGTGGSKSIHKIIMRVHVRHKATGQNAWVLNSHIVPGIESGGRLRTLKPPKGGTSRLFVYDAQMDALTAEMARLGRGGVPVAATGDFNLDWASEAGRDLERRMDKVNAVCNWDALPDVDTHGDRTIDYVWWLNAQGRGQKFPGKFGSDHTSIVVDLEPILGDYVVDPAKVTTFLYGLNVEDPDNKAVAKRRPPGYVIDSGEDIIHLRDADDRRSYPWLVTEAGYRYRMDYLKAVN